MKHFTLYSLRSWRRNYMRGSVRNRTSTGFSGLLNRSGSLLRTLEYCREEKDVIVHDLSYLEGELVDETCISNWHDLRENRALKERKRICYFSIEIQGLIE